MDTGDEEFHELFFGHADRVTRLAALLGAEDPEDVAAESFCRLYAARSRLRGQETDVVAYLNRIVVNDVRDRARRRLTAKEKSHLLADAAAPSTAGADGSRVAVITALRSLPERQREALVLRFWLDLPLAEVADAMGVRTGTAKSLVSRGLATLEKHLEDRG
jgi:RNA polymerase sigma factor (sigma-70 family)